MIKFIVYKSGGEIVRVGSCPESQLEYQAQEGEFVKVGVASQLTQRINAKGKIVRRKSPKNGVVEAAVMKMVRAQRNALLLETDYVEQSSAIQRLGAEKVGAIKAYRKRLFDFPSVCEGVKSFDSIIWPKKPGV